MVYYRIALQADQLAPWKWKSEIMNSLQTVLNLLNMYRNTPKEYIRVFLSSSPRYLEEMLVRENQGSLSTALTIKQLWDSQRTDWAEIKRLEIELGPMVDHDCPYTFTLPTDTRQTLAWSNLLARVERGELEP